MRDNFSQSTKDILGKQVGFICSNPGCRALTIGGHEDSTKATLLGEAAHITAAAKGGKRFDETLTEKERSDISNGIWLCCNCATMIDKNQDRYPVELLRKWKQDAITESTQQLGKSRIQDDAINQIKEQIIQLAGGTGLVEEWTYQLDEIADDLQKFKAHSAISRLNKLERRIQEAGITNNKLLARLISLKCACRNIILDNDPGIEHCSWLVKIYKLQPLVAEYKSNAAVAYYVLGEMAEAKILAEEILRENEEDVPAWITKVMLAGDMFLQMLDQVPASVKDKPVFKIHLYRWLRSRGCINEYKDFEKYGLHFDIDSTTPLQISYKNLRYNVFVAEYLLLKFFNRYPFIEATIDFSGRLQDELLNYLCSILQTIKEQVSGTEIEQGYELYFFYCYYLEMGVTNNKEHIREMEDAFNQLKTKDRETLVHMMQAYTTMATADYDLKAVSIAEQYGRESDDVIELFKANLYATLGDKANKTRAFLAFIEKTPQVDRLFFRNFFGFVRKHFHDGLGDIKDELAVTLGKITLTENIYSLLLKVFCFTSLRVGEYSKAQMIQAIDLAKESLDPEDAEMQYEVAIAYCAMDEPQKAKNFLQPIVVTSKPSALLKLYCKILYSVQGDKPQLISVLKNWRENFPPDDTLLRIEFDIRRIQHRWDECLSIAEAGLKIAGDADFYIHAVFVSLMNDHQLSEIESRLDLLRDKLFVVQEQAVNISVALMRADLHQQAFEFLYRHAVQKQNWLCRQRFLQLVVMSPVKLLSDPGIAEIGNFINYRIGERKESFELTKENITYEPGSLLVGKKVGETISVKQPLTGLLSMITIESISDKYSKLFDELMLETEDPLMAHPFQTFKFDDSSAEGMQKSFIENFGIQGSLAMDRYNEQMEMYYSGQISFSELTNSVFRQKAIDAYFTLTDISGKYFRAVPAAINKDVHFPDDTRFVLDFTTLCLFFECSTELQVSFTHKFLLPRSIKECVEDELMQTRLAPQSKLSVNITKDRIIPHFYPGDFKEKRIALFENMLSWIKEYCVLQDVDEKLNWVMVENGQHEELDTVIDILLDLHLLSNRPGNLLLTNDVIHYRKFGRSAAEVISPFRYIQQYLLKDYPGVPDLLLQKNYIGIPINDGILTRELQKRNLGQKNNLMICIENLNYAWNPEPDHINEVIKFIRYLYLNALMEISIRDSIICMTLKSLFTGMDANLIKKTYQQFIKDFKLLPEQSMDIRVNMYVVLRELRSENKLN